MMSRTLGAPLGGTIVGGHHTFESFSTALTSPANFDGIGGMARDASGSWYAGEPGAGGPPEPPTVMGTKKAPTPPATTRTRMAARAILAFVMISLRSPRTRCATVPSDHFGALTTT